MPSNLPAFATLLMAIRKKSLGIPIAITALMILTPVPLGRRQTHLQLLMQEIAGSPARANLLAEGQPGHRVVNVKRYGARGDGMTNDTAAIQAAIDSAPDQGTIYFPPGTYVVSNFRVSYRSGLSFVGDGRKSVMKQRTGAGRIATFDGARDISITNLTFDANGINTYGGVVFYAVKGILIENTRFFDSRPQPPGPGDRYSYVFARGRSPSRDVRIMSNQIDDLQLEVDHAQQVHIEGNVVSRAVSTAGIGIFTINDHAVAEDYLITGNTVIDPIGAGFNAGLDPPKNSHCVFRRIQISGNKIIRTTTAGYGIRIGTPDNSAATTGNVFEDIIIKDNIIRIDQAAPARRVMIFANTSATAGFIFTRLVVAGNQIENHGARGTGYAIALRRIQYSTVSGNSVRGIANGISLTGDLLQNEVRDNEVEASGIAYQLVGSLGETKAHNNHILGNPTTRWKVSGLKPSDSVDIGPTSAAPR
jgi:hypothetical protein